MNYARPCLLALCLAAGGCALNPVTGKSDFAIVSEAEEIEQGAQFHPQIIARYGVYDDAALQKYVNRVGQRLAAKSHRANLKYSFTVLDSPEINAFALPGGYIYITRGIMAYLDSEAELAGVLGHEIGHVTARHSVRQQSGEMASGILGVLIAAATGSSSLGNLGQTLGTGLVRGYGREHELEADRLGAEYLHQSGYDPDNMLDVIGVLKDQEVYERERARREGREPSIYHGVFSTHPENDDRLKTVVRQAKNLSAKQYRDNDRDGYRRRIEGLVWGPSPRQGVLRGSRFSHPGFGFALDLPRGWAVVNNADFLQASDPDGSARLQLGVTRRERDETLHALARRLTGNQQLEVATEPYGVTATATVALAGARQPARFSAIALGDRDVLTLVGTARADGFDTADRKLLAVNRSFVRLDAAQIDAIEVPRLRIIERGARNWQALARASALEDDAETRLRLLNRAYPNGSIRKFERLKTVTYDE